MTRRVFVIGVAAAAVVGLAVVLWPKNGKSAFSFAAPKPTVPSTVKAVGSPTAAPSITSLPSSLLNFVPGILSDVFAQPSNPAPPQASIPSSATFSQPNIPPSLPSPTFAANPPLFSATLPSAPFMPTPTIQSGLDSGNLDQFSAPDTSFSSALDSGQLDQFSA